MLKAMIACLMVVTSAAVALAEPVSPSVEKPAVAKKLIEFGWDEPDTAFMRKHIAQMDVWIYSEQPRWWSNEGHPIRLPPAYEAAIRRAAFAPASAPSPTRPK